MTVPRCNLRLVETRKAKSASRSIEIRIFLVRQDAGDAELYEAATATWADAGSLNSRRYDHTATLLSDGRVLVAGGESAGGESFNVPLGSAELYIPSSSGCE